MYWLPIAPFGEIDLLIADDRPVYLQRFLARTHEGGWLVVQNVDAFESHWVVEEVSRWCRPTRTVTGADWTATYYQYVGSGA